MSVHAADFWKVNSYGYPNPFVTDVNAQRAWETLLSFYEFPSYSRLKDYWVDPKAPRRITPHSVESWKATFEEFGLLYVLTGSDDIRITPAGMQFRSAADAGRQQEFAWIGLSLLLRYPLRGPRGQRGGRHSSSDLLLYWFFYAAMRELQDYFWWTELERVLCQVFRVDEAEAAVANVLRLRSGQVKPDDLPLPVTDRRGAFYNSLNQVAVHAGLNHFVLGKSADESLYEPQGGERRHWILKQWLPTLDLALGGTSTVADCEGGTRFLARMPKAPSFDDEQSYFEYAGAEVKPPASVGPGAAVPNVAFEGGTVAVLKEGTHYTRTTTSGPTEIAGKVTILCQLARGQRVVLSHDLARSYIIEDKTRSGPDALTLRVRRARPISNPALFLPLLGETNG